MTVNEMLTRCSSAEIQEWKVLYKIEAAEADMARQRHAAGVA